MSELRCPNCDAPVKIYPNERVHTCEYCGYTFTIKGEEVKAYMLSVNYTEKQAFDLLVDWTRKQPGVPEDFESSASLSDFKLKFFPYWIANVYAVTNYFGYGKDATYSNPAPRPGAYFNIHFFKKEERGVVERRYEVSLLATQQAEKELYTYKFSSRAKVDFDISEVKKRDGLIIQSTYDRPMFENYVKKYVFDKQTTHILKEIDTIVNRQDSIDIKEIVLIYLPVYIIKYRYKNKEYVGYVDASSGHIIFSVVPIKTTFRLFALLLGLGTFIPGTLSMLNAFMNYTDALQLFMVYLILGIYLMVFGGLSLYMALRSARMREKKV